VGIRAVLMLVMAAPQYI